MKELQQGPSGRHWLQRLVARLVQSRRISSILSRASTSALVSAGLDREGSRYRDVDSTSDTY